MNRKRRLSLMALRATRTALCVTLCAAFCAVMFTACGSSSKSDSSYAREEPVYEDYDSYGSDFSGAMAEEAYDMEDAAYEDGGNSGTSGLSDEVTGDDVSNTSGKIIRNASLSLLVDDLYAFADNLSSTVKKFGGYIESSDVHDFESEYSESRDGYFVVRIPSNKMDSFMSIVQEKGNVTSKNETAEDVTLQYVDIQAHISSYESERDSLEELMKKADKIEDIITIKEKLTEVNYELDSLNRQLRSMDNRISYSTVTINASEKRSLSKPTPSFGSKFWENFVSEFQDGIEAALNIIVFIVTRIPVFAVLILIFYLAFRIILALRDKIFGDSAKRAERKKAKEAERKAKAEARKAAEAKRKAQAGAQRAAGSTAAADNKADVAAAPASKDDNALNTSDDGKNDAPENKADGKQSE